VLYIYIHIFIAPTLTTFPLCLVPPPHAGYVVLICLHSFTEFNINFSTFLSYISACPTARTSQACSKLPLISP